MSRGTWNLEHLWFRDAQRTRSVIQANKKEGYGVYIHDTKCLHAQDKIKSKEQCFYCCSSLQSLSEAFNIEHSLTYKFKTAPSTVWDVFFALFQCSSLFLIFRAIKSLLYGLRFFTVLKTVQWYSDAWMICIVILTWWWDFFSLDIYLNSFLFLTSSKEYDLQSS